MLFILDYRDGILLGRTKPIVQVRSFLSSMAKLRYLFENKFGMRIYLFSHGKL